MRVMRVLLIEDDAVLGRALDEFLKGQGYAVDWLTEGRQVIETLTLQAYDLVLLDLNLPDTDGLVLLSQMRSQAIMAPVLILTARDGVNERVAGLDCGADDYLVKPFELPELAARVRVFARRQSQQALSRVQAGPLWLDSVNREITAEGERLALSAREFSVLEMLMMRSGRVVTKQQIVNSLSAWDTDFSENAVEVYIYRLRKRLDTLPVSIQTIRGFGYMLNVADDGAAAG